ncbi:MAG TPA: nuclear transport factor 2 family protein [Acidimicrobiia bacterium]|nr:nuclear transport factor 2 family protein [Acidimicrobiia bacterium]
MDVEARLQALERQVVELQDSLDVLRVVASYGPSVDGGAAAEAGLLWTEDCTYDSDNAADPLRGRTTIEELSERVGQVPMGVAHFLNLPVVVVDGDRATVTGHSNTYHQEDGKYVVARVSSNRWELEKIDGRWQIRSRVNRILDGNQEAKELLARGIRESFA